MIIRGLCSLALSAAVALPGGTGDGAGQPDDVRAVAALARFDATDLEGRRWSRAEFRGRVVLLDFWATWCAPCLADIPRLQALRARYSREDFEIVGISLDATSRRSLISFLNRNRVDWPQIHQPRAYSSDVARLFRVDRLPATVLVDRNGSVSAVDLRGDSLAARVQALVTAGKPSEPSP